MLGLAFTALYLLESATITVFSFSLLLCMGFLFSFLPFLYSVGWWSFFLLFIFFVMVHYLF